MSEGKYIEGAVAASLILEIFDGQTDVPRQEIERKVTELYLSRGGSLDPSPAAYPAVAGFEHLIRQKKADNPKRGFWSIDSNGFKPAQQNTRLESEGAEFLVLGQLLIRRISTYKAYMNMPGYDLVATHPENNTSARIQVKSRWETGAREFIIKNYDCDFVVFVRLNRGKKDGTGEVHAPEYFVFPVAVVKDVPTDTIGQLKIDRIKNLENYLRLVGVNRRLS